MIARYTRSEMGRVWSEENKFRKWLEVELAATETLADAGIVPREAAAKLRERARIDVARINEIEAKVRHDVIAFTIAVQETVGDPEAARWLHYGLTSNDVVDTAQALLIREASQLIEKDHRAIRRSARKARVGIQGHARNRPNARHPRRADHFRAENSELVRRKSPRCRALRSRRARDGCRENFRRGRHVHAPRPRNRAENLPASRPGHRSDHLAGDRARPPRAISFGARDRRRVARARGDRNSPPAAHRSARSRGAFWRRAARQLGDAAQAQSRVERADLRARARGPGELDGVAREYRAVARARHLAQLGRARDSSRFDDPRRLYAAPNRRKSSRT